MKVLISGANGYLGSLIVDYLSKKGFECIRLVRSPADLTDRKFTLGDDIKDDVFQDIDIFIHAAHDFKALKWHDSYRINVEGSAKLFAMANKCGVKSIIFISSMSSFDGCKSNYGKAKLAIEKEVAKFTNGYIIRPGLIYGSKEGGMVLALAKLAKLPMLPAIKTTAPLYFCHYLDLLELIRQIALGNVPVKANPIIAANQTPYTFYQILKEMGARVLIPFWWQPLWLLLKVVEFCGLKPRTGSDNLISLVNQNPNPDFRSHKLINVAWRSFDGDCQ